MSATTWLIIAKMCIRDRVLNQYYYVRRKLNNLDTSTVTESYAQAHGGGGGGSF